MIALTDPSKSPITCKKALRTFKFSEVSPFIKINAAAIFTSSPIKLPVNLELTPSFQVVVAILFEILFFIMIFLSYYKKKTPVLGVILAICFIISTYISLMVY